MKIARLSLFLLALTLSSFAVPEAFGGKGGGGGKKPDVNNKSESECGGIYIWCYYNPSTACCYGTWEGGCSHACEDMCGGPCDYYAE
jgi:hypothetical protein